MLEEAISDMNSEALQEAAIRAMTSVGIGVDKSEQMHVLRNGAYVKVQSARMREAFQRRFLILLQRQLHGVPKDVSWQELREIGAMIDLEYRRYQD